MAKNPFEDLYELAEGDTSFIKEIFELMLKAIPADIKAMEKAVKKKDLEAAKKSAHHMKSSIQYSGDSKLLKLIDTIEKQKANQKSFEETQKTLLKIKELSEALLTNIKVVKKSL
jgi:HPt (histidine-containing phosphotransfer) domain-containing protein